MVRRTFCTIKINGYIISDQIFDFPIFRLIKYLLCNSRENRSENKKIRQCIIIYKGTQTNFI